MDVVLESSEFEDSPNALIRMGVMGGETEAADEEVEHAWKRKN